MDRRNWALVAMFIMFASLVISCSDEESGDESENHNCEAECTIDYLADLPSCESESMGCILDCTGPEDTECIDSCESCIGDMETSLHKCMMDCMCYIAFYACTTDCDVDDIDCITACGDEYASCAGDAALYPILDNCISARHACTDECETSSADLDEYLDCRQECTSVFNDCILDLSE